MIMYIKRANLLLSEIGRYLDDGNLVLDENNCAFVWLSNMLFSFTLAEDDEEEKQEIICVVHICPFPCSDDKITYDFLLQLLCDNHAWKNTGGGMFGIDEQTGFVCLCLQVDIFSLEVNEFPERIACLYLIALEWRERLINVLLPEI
ncbi:type III secretion system chaperone [Salmonella enterica]|nr:type III secretion system chaperone [Salmonella enterica]